MGISVVVVGLRFGEAFLRIFVDHPDVDKVGIFDINEEASKKIAEKYKIDHIYNSYEEILEDKSVDAVYLMSPIPFHVQQTIQALEAGKHCGCAVTMGQTLEELEQIVDAVERTGKNYMMMETSIYTYHSFYIKKMLADGVMGKIQFMRGSYYQDFAGLSEVWKKIPPMMYATHAIAPLVDFSGSRVKKVTCFGTGKMEDGWGYEKQNPWPMEYAMLEFENGLKAAVEKSMYELAKQYQEAVYIYGDKASFEWGLKDGDSPFVTVREDISHLLSSEKEPYEADIRMITTKISLPNPYKRLPKELWKYTVGEGMYSPEDGGTLDEGRGAGHHGSHGHMVHEFVTSILKRRKPYIDVYMGANITATGICAHQSALLGGKSIELPHFTRKLAKSEDVL